MGNQISMQAVVVAGTTMKNDKTTAEISLFNADGTAVTPLKKQAAQADTVAADLTAMKVDFNALLAKLRLAGVIS